MTHEEIAKQILSLEQNPSYHPGAKGTMEGDSNEFKEDSAHEEEKAGKDFPSPSGSKIKRGVTSVGRKHVGRGGKY